MSRSTTPNRGWHPLTHKQQPIRERPLWLFLTEPGLGPLLVKELKFLDAIEQKAQPARLHLRNYDLLTIPDAVMKNRTMRARLALHAMMCPVFGRDRIGENQLEQLALHFAKERCDGLVSSVVGEKFRRQEFSQWIRRRLIDRGARVSDKAEPRKPLWMLIVDEKYYFGFPRFNHHEAPGRAREAEREGSLPPVIAAAMSFVAKPGKGEVIWDPVVGSGTVLNEIAHMARDADLIGTDIDADGLSVARKNLGGIDAELMRGDSTSMHLGRNDISLTIGNLPFGKQYKAATNNRDLYEGILRNALRHAGHNWRGVFLTSDEDAIREAAGAIDGLEIAEAAKVLTRGQKASIWLVTRR